MTPSTDELRESVTALWHAVACRIGPRRFREAYRADPRGALIHCFSATVIDAYRERHRAIVKWLETAELPSELTQWDPTDGFNGSCIAVGGLAGRNGHFVIGGDAACCELDPDYVWDPEVAASFERVDAVRNGLLRQGWRVPPIARCSHHEKCKRGRR